MIFDRLLERKETDISGLTWTELVPQNNSRSGVSVNIDSALRTTTVFACARVLAEGIAQLPKNLFDIDPIKNTKTKNITHPAYRLLAIEPNDFMTSFEFYETMMFHAVLAGDAFAYIGWSGDKIKEIIPLVPGNVQIVRAVDWSLTYIVSDLEGKTTTLHPENVLHLRGPSWDSYRGLSAVALAREAIGLAIATEETHASLHANGAQPGGVLAVKGRLDAPARERLKAAWGAFQGGVANRFKTAVLDVDAEWKPLSMSGVDSQHLETRRFQIEEICRAMRVFPQLVMHSDKTSTFASAEQFFLAHVTHSLMPWIVRWEQAINRVILGDNDNLVCKFNVSSLMRGDAAQQATYFQAALGGARGETAWMTRNEVREALDLNPIEGGDKLPMPPPAPVQAPGYGSGAALSKALDIIAKSFDPAQPRDDTGRWSSGGTAVAIRNDHPDNGGGSHIRSVLAAAGGTALIAGKAILAHLIVSGAARALIRYSLSMTGGQGMVLAVAADIALDHLLHHLTKKDVDNSALLDAISGLSDGDANRLATAVVERLTPDQVQELVSSFTAGSGSVIPAAKMNPNHDDAGRFATGGGGTSTAALVSLWKELSDSLSDDEMHPQVRRMRQDQIRQLELQLNARSVTDRIAAGYYTGSKMNPNHDGLGRFASGAGLHGQGIEQAITVKRGWIAQSPIKSLDDAYASAHQNKPTLDAIGAAVAQETGAEYKDGPIKKAERVQEKIAKGKTPASVSDIVRSTFYAKSTADADKVVQSLAKRFAVVDEGYRQTEAGYFDRPVNVKFDNGQIGEVLIMPKEMAEAKGGGGHVLYEGTRKLPQSHPMREVLLDTSKSFYRRVYDTLPDDWKAVVGSAGSLP